MTEIKGACRTNIDDCKFFDWPTHFSFPPRVGDSVESARLKDGHYRKLKVVQVTHLFDGTIEVELHR